MAPSGSSLADTGCRHMLEDHSGLHGPNPTSHSDPDEASLEEPHRGVRGCVRVGGMRAGRRGEFFLVSGQCQEREGSHG